MELEKVYINKQANVQFLCQFWVMAECVPWADTINRETDNTHILAKIRSKLRNQNLQE